MQKQTWLALVSLLAALLAASVAPAGETEHQHELKIMLATDGDDVIDTDISDLEVGESQSFVTKSGKTIDIIRTAEGAEVYIDGELQELGFGDLEAHGEHVIVHRDVEVECISDNPEACEEHEFVFVEADGDYSYSTGADEDGFVHKRVEVICEDNGECEKTVWVSGDEEDLQATEGHKVIRIHEESSHDD